MSVPPALRREADLLPVATDSRPHEIETRLRELGRAGGAIRRVLAALAGRFVARSAFSELGYARLRDYSRERLGMSARKVQELAQIDGRLAGLPLLEAALVSGELGWSRVRLVARVASPEDEAEWIALARRASVRSLERQTRAVDRGAFESVKSDEEGQGTEPEERLAVRAPLAVAFKWRRVLHAARKVAGEEARPAELLEWVTAEALSGLSLTPLGDDDESAEARLEGVDCDAGSTASERGNGRAEPAPAVCDGGGETEAGLRERPHAVDPMDDGSAGRVARNPEAAEEEATEDAAAALPAFLEPLVAELAAADAFELDARLRRAVRLEHRLEAELAPLLRRVLAPDFEWSDRHRSLAELARDWLGISPRKASALVRLEVASDRCPELGRGWREGTLSWVQAQHLARLIAKGETDHPTLPAWVEFAEGVSVRRLSEAVDRALVLRDTDPLGELPEPAAVVGLSEADILGLENDVRKTCAHPTRSNETVQIRVSAPRDVAGLFRSTLCRVRLSTENTTGKLPSPGEAFEAMLDHALTSWGVEDHWLKSRSRRQNAIFERDGWRCTVPGCTSRRELQAHHIVFRSKGGSDAQENQTTLCAFHHLRGVHEGRVRISGRAPERLIFELGTRPGSAPLVRYDSNERILGSESGLA